MLFSNPSYLISSRLDPHIIICYGTDEMMKRSELKSITLVIISFILITEVDVFDP